MYGDNRLQVLVKTSSVCLHRACPTPYALAKPGRQRRGGGSDLDRPLGGVNFLPTLTNSVSGAGLTPTAHSLSLSSAVPEGGSGTRALRSRVWITAGEAAAARTAAGMQYPSPPPLRQCLSTPSLLDAAGVSINRATLPFSPGVARSSSAPSPASTSPLTTSAVTV